MLKVNRLKKEYRRAGKPFLAVNDVSLSVEEGEFVCVIGRSGSGKSTLLNMIAGLLAPTSGNISADGRDYALLSDDDLSLLRNTRIGYIPQGHSILSNFTVLDNVILPFCLYKREGDPTGRAKELLEAVGILPLARLYPSQLSGGELRRVSIARALVQSPKLLVADESTSDLDTQTTKEIMELFSRISAEGTAVIMATHELDATGYGNRLLVMNSGSFIEESGK